MLHDYPDLDRMRDPKADLKEKPLTEHKLHFASLPIPKAVWEDMKALQQDPDFVKFVESRLRSKEAWPANAKEVPQGMGTEETSCWPDPNLKITPHKTAR